jgi:hypothetical protein
VRFQSNLAATLIARVTRGRAHAIVPVTATTKNTIKT